MINLVIKDILLQKRHFVMSFLYILIIIFAFQRIGPAMFPASIVGFTYMLLLTSLAYEEKNNADIFINSLPVNRTTIVLSKYVSAVLYAVTGMVLYVLYTTVLGVINVPIEIYPVSSVEIVGTLLSFSLMVGIYLPVFFKFGYIKSRMAFMIMFFGFFFGVPQVANFLYLNRDKGWVISLIRFFTGNQVMALMSMVLLAIIILCISYLLAVYFYRKREF